MSIVGMVKISQLIEKVKIFLASHSLSLHGWLILNPKPCKKLLFQTNKFMF